MQLDLEKYALEPRDTRKENALAQQLRQLPEEERFALIWECLQYQAALGLRLATACLQKPAYFQQILEYGLQRADASSIHAWLDCVIPKMGFRRVVTILMQTLETDSRAVEKALYWLPRFLPSGDVRALEALHCLKNKTQSQERMAASI